MNDRCSYELIDKPVSWIFQWIYRLCWWKLHAKLHEVCLDNVYFRPLHNANVIHCKQPHRFHRAHRRSHNSLLIRSPVKQKKKCSVKTFSSKIYQIFEIIFTLIPNTELKSSMIMCRSSICRRVFLTPFAEYNGGRFNDWDGINLSNCKLSNKLWQTSFIFDMDNCINFRVWYSESMKKWIDLIVASGLIVFKFNPRCLL